MNEITIRAVWDIDHDGTRIAPGGTAVLPAETAHALIESGAAEAAETPADTAETVNKAEAPADRQAALAAAIAGLENGNPDHWTKSGRPEVRALEAATGLTDISAAERDAAWAEHTEQR